MIKSKVIALFIIISTLHFITSAPEAFAQEEGLSGGSIKSQFDYLKSVSSNYQEYKVVRRSHLDQLEANIADSVNSFKRQITEINNQLREQKASIEQLNTEITQTNEELEDAISKKDSFYFFGTYVHKNLYNNLMWGAVILLAVVLAISYFRFKRSHIITAETRKRLEEIQEEYEQHRKNTLERERKLNRQLVDALNKR